MKKPEFVLDTDSGFQYNNRCVFVCFNSPEAEEYLKASSFYQMKGESFRRLSL